MNGLRSEWDTTLVRHYRESLFSPFIPAAAEPEKIRVTPANSSGNSNGTSQAAQPVAIEKQRRAPVGDK